MRVVCVRSLASMRGATMALTDAEVKSMWVGVMGSTAVGGSVCDNVPLRLGRGLVDPVNDAARRVAVSQGQTPNAQTTVNDFILAALKLATQAVANPSADDQIRLNRAGW
jgi:hypothetical protein